MEPLEHANNKDLLSTLAGPSAAQALMEKYSGLTNLAQASFDELQLVKGIGKSKAAAIKSAFLLAQRLSRESYAAAPVLDTPERIADFLREKNRVYTVETFQVVFLNTRRRLVGVQNISQGTLDTILVHPREVFKSAIAANAACLVLAHNHPSGDPSPSAEDVESTRRLKRAGEIVGIPLLDGLVIGHESVVSMQERGLL